MPILPQILKIPLNGTGTEIPVLNTNAQYELYLISGVAIATGNYAITETGTPLLGMIYNFKYKATLDITTNGTTFSIFGVSITQAQLLKEWELTCYYNGASWDVILKMDFSETGIISSANVGNLIILNANLANNDIDACTKLLNLSVCTAKINDLAVTTGKVNDLAITDAKLAADSVTTVKILDSNVTNAKLATMANNTIKGNVSGGSANPSDLSISTLINSNAWGLSGNSGTIAGTNFIGTTDSTSLVFKVNSQLAGDIGGSLTNTSIGLSTLEDITTGNDNAAFGNGTLQNTTTGSSNSGFGGACLIATTIGSFNTAIGNSSGATITVGSGNTCIGATANVSSNSATERIALGSGALADTDNQFALPDNVTEIKALGIISVKFGGLAEYDDNAAALLGGLVAGDLYATTGSGTLATRGVICQVF